MLSRIKSLLLILLIIIPTSQTLSSAQTNGNDIYSPYFTKQEKLSQWLTLFDRNDCNYTIIGYTYLNQPIYAFVCGSPQGGRVLWDAEIHGNEDNGGLILYFLAKWLLTSGSEAADKILRENYVMFVPMLNYDSDVRGNANNNYSSYGVDLNRNFYTGWKKTLSDLDTSSGLYPGSEPETRALRSLFNTFQPYCYTNVHVGAGPEILYYYKSNTTVIKEIINKMKDTSVNLGIRPYSSSWCGSSGYAIGDAFALGVPTTWLIEAVGRNEAWLHTDYVYNKIQTQYELKCRTLFIAQCEISRKYDNSSYKPVVSTEPVSNGLSTIFINSDGTVTPTNSGVVRIGSIYNIDQDLENSNLKIKRSNIIINGKGHLLSGANISASVGIEFSNVNNVTVNNLIIADYEYGILFQKSNDNQVSNNNFRNNIFDVYTDNQSPSNKVYYNIFRSNIHSSSKNIWDNGYEGNYWINEDFNDLFSGPYQNQIGSDGLSDLPYFIDEDNIDRYPIVGIYYDFIIDSQELYLITNSSTIRSYYNNTEPSIRLDIENSEEKPGFCRISIPNSFLNTNHLNIIVKNQINNVTYKNLNLLSSSTRKWIYLSYPSDTSMVIINSNVNNITKPQINKVIQIPDKNTVYPGNSVKIYADISDNNVKINNITLQYSINNNKVDILMNKYNVTTYIGELMPKTSGSNIVYNIIIYTDNDLITSPEFTYSVKDKPDSYFSTNNYIIGIGLFVIVLITIKFRK